MYYCKVYVIDLCLAFIGYHNSAVIMLHAISFRLGTSQWSRALTRTTQFCQKHLSDGPRPCWIASCHATCRLSTTSTTNICRWSSFHNWLQESKIMHIRKWDEKLALWFMSLFFPFYFFMLLFLLVLCSLPSVRLSEHNYFFTFLKFHQMNEQMN
jgi:hypothetical protein